MAHQNTRPAKLLYAEGNLDDAGVNRSPTSYEANPEIERKM